MKYVFKFTLQDKVAADVKRMASVKINSKATERDVIGNVLSVEASVNERLSVAFYEVPPTGGRWNFKHMIRNLHVGKLQSTPVVEGMTIEVEKVEPATAPVTPPTPPTPPPTEPTGDEVPKPNVE